MYAAVRVDEHILPHTKQKEKSFFEKRQK